MSKFEDLKLSIELKYSKETVNPVKVLESFKLMFESVMKIQTELVRKANPLLNINFVLADIKSASVWGDLVTEVITVEETGNELLTDETKGNLNDYITKSTELVIQKMAHSKERIIHNHDIHELVDKIKEIADSTRVSETPNYKKPSLTVFADALDDANQATNLLPMQDSFYFIRDKQEPISLNKVYIEIDKKSLLSEDKSKIIERDAAMTLKIKIADFLGTAKWKFLTEEGKIIEAKIDDDGWLDNFHNNGSPTLCSGDALEIDAHITESFDSSGKLVDTEYVITKIKRIVHYEIQ
ncbi:MAG: hypothetical protein ACTTI0_00360 [Treponema sp.]